MKNKTGIMTVLLLAGMALMIPCYLFTAGNTLLAPWTLYDRNRALLAVLTAMCAAALLLAAGCSGGEDAQDKTTKKKEFLPWIKT